MIHNNVRAAVALLLAILIFASPVSRAGATAVSAAKYPQTVQNSANSLPFNLEKELGDLVNRGVFDPLLETVGDYFRGLLNDPRLEGILNEIIDEILADERVPGLDTVAVDVLRDERLAQILGDVIGDHLADEELFRFIEQIAAEVGALLKNETFVIFFQQAVTGLLRDDGVNAFAFQIIEALIDFPRQVLANLGDGSLDQAVLDVVEELAELFRKPLLEHSADILGDPRVSEALEKILNRVGELPGETVEALLADEAFQNAVHDLAALFLEPLEDLPRLFIEQLLEAGALHHLQDLFLAELLQAANYSELSPLLDGLMLDADNVLETIGEEVSAVVAYYAANAMDGDGGYSIIDIISDFVLDESAVIEQAGDFMLYWADVAAWVAGQKSEEIFQFLEKYFGDGAPYTEDLFNALEAASTRSGENLVSALTPVMEEHLAGFDLAAALEPILEAHLDQFFNSTFDEVLLETLAGMPADELLQLVHDKGLALLEILEELITALPSEMPGDPAAGTEDNIISVLLEDIVLEIPFEVLAELISEGDVQNLVDGLFDLIAGLPLDSIAPHIRSNAHQLGHTIASTLLNGLADSIEARDPEQPEDPRRAAIMAILKNEERMRRFYLDLGGSDPDLISAESGEAQVIFSVILEIAGHGDRVEQFLEELKEQSLPVREELIDYGRMIGNSFSRGVRALLRPFMQGFFSLFSFFYESDAEGGPAQWLRFEHMAVDMKRTTGLTVEMLRDSGASGFLDQSVSRFLLEHGAVEDTATVERFSAINLFFAEMLDAEQLKTLAAEETATELAPAISTGMLSLRDSIAGRLDVLQVTSTVNSFLAGLIPGAPGELYRLSIDSTPFTAKSLMELISGPVEDGVFSVRELFDSLVQPVAEIPGELLGDERTANALDDIFAALPRTALDLAAGLLKDERVKESVRAAAEEILVEALDRSLDLAVQIAEDPRLQPAIEEAVVTVAADDSVRRAVADLVGDLLADPELHGIIRSILDNSRRIAIEYTGNNHAGFYDGGEHDFTGHPDLPAPYPFQNVTIRVFTLGIVPAYDHYHQLGCNNGLYFFTEVLMEWFDPQTGFSSQSPGEYMRSYVYDYMSEERIRTRVAEPAAGLAVSTALNILNERGRFEDLLKQGLDHTLDADPMGTIAVYLQSDPKIGGLIEDSLKGFPLESVVQTLKHNQSIYGLVNDLFGGIPVEQLAAYLGSGENVESLIEDFGVEFTLDPLRPLLRADQGMIAGLSGKALNFPAETVADFFEAEQRSYRLGYITADMQSRFAAGALEKPELALFQSEVIQEIAAEADYTLAKSIFDATARILEHESLIEYGGELFFDSLARAYEKVKDFFSSLWGRRNKGSVETAPQPANDLLYGEAGA